MNANTFDTTASEVFTVSQLSSSNQTTIFLVVYFNKFKSSWNTEINGQKKNVALMVNLDQQCTD